MKIRNLPKEHYEHRIDRRTFVNSAVTLAVGAGLAIMTVLSVWILCGHIQPLSPRSEKSA